LPYFFYCTATHCAHFACRLLHAHCYLITHCWFSFILPVYWFCFVALLRTTLGLLFCTCRLHCKFCTTHSYTVILFTLHTPYTLDWIYCIATHTLHALPPVRASPRVARAAHYTDSPPAAPPLYSPTPLARFARNASSSTACRFAGAPLLSALRPFGWRLV